MKLQNNCCSLHQRGNILPPPQCSSIQEFAHSCVIRSVSRLVCSGCSLNIPDSGVIKYNTNGKGVFKDALQATCTSTSISGEFKFKAIDIFYLLNVKIRSQCGLFKITVIAKEKQRLDNRRAAHVSYLIKVDQVIEKEACLRIGARNLFLIVK